VDVSAERHFCDGCLTVVRVAIGRFWRSWSLSTFLDLGLSIIGTWAGPPIFISETLVSGENLKSRRAELNFDLWVDYGGTKFSLPKMVTNLGHQILIFTILRG
jgi:hypothetical protein